MVLIYPSNFGDKHGADWHVKIGELAI